MTTATSVRLILLRTLAFHFPAKGFLNDQSAISKGELGCLACPTKLDKFNNLSHQIRSGGVTPGGGETKSAGKECQST